MPEISAIKYDAAPKVSGGGHALSEHAMTIALVVLVIASALPLLLKHCNVIFAKLTGYLDFAATM